MSQDAERVVPGCQTTTCINCGEEIHRFGYDLWRDRIEGEICVEHDALNGVFEYHLPPAQYDGTVAKETE